MVLSGQVFVGLLKGFGGGWVGSEKSFHRKDWETRTEHWTTPNRYLVSPIQIDPRQKLDWVYTYPNPLFIYALWKNPRLLPSGLEIICSKKEGFFCNSLIPVSAWLLSSSHPEKKGYQNGVHGVLLLQIVPFFQRTCFLSPPEPMHGGLLCVTFCLSVCASY